MVGASKAQSKFYQLLHKRPGRQKLEKSGNDMDANQKVMARVPAIKPAAEANPSDHAISTEGMQQARLHPCS